MAMPVERHDFWRVVTLVGVLVGTVGLAVVVARQRVEAVAGRLAKTVVARGMVVSVPSQGWQRIEEPQEGMQATTDPNSPDDEGLVVVQEVGKSQAGNRRVRAMLLKPPVVCPPGRFLSEFYQFSAASGGTRVMLGGFPATFVQLEERSREAESGGVRRVAEPKREIWAAAVTLPSGRVGLVEMTRTGEIDAADGTLFRQIVESVAFPGEIASQAGEDALERLRSRPLMSPVEQVNMGRVGVAGRLGETFVVTTTPNGRQEEVAVVEVIPVVWPTLPPGDSEEDEENRKIAEGFARLVASQQDRAFVGAETKRIGTRRVMLTPTGKQVFSVSGLAVWSEQTPGLGALVVARGGVGSEAVLTVLLNRAADLLTFERRADDFAGMVVEGVKVASVSSTPAGTENYGIIWREGKRELVGWSRVTVTGTVETRRVATLIERAVRSVRERRRFPGGEPGINLSLAYWFRDSFIERLSHPIPGLVRANAQVTPELARNNPWKAMSEMGTYVPGHLLLEAITRVGEGTTLLTTDAIPWLATESDAEIWQLLAWRAANEQRAWYIHAVGTGKTALVRYDADGGPTDLEWVGTTIRGKVIRPVEAMDATLPTEGPLAP